MTINAIVCRLPLLGEDHIVLFNHVLDPVGSSQDLLTVLLSIRLNLTDLGPVGPLLPFSIVHLKERKRQ